MNRGLSEKQNYRWVILAGVFSVQSTISMAAYSFGPLAPFLREDLGATRLEIGLFSSLIALASVLFSIPSGWLVDRFGVRRLLLIGPALFALVFTLLRGVPSIGAAYAVVFVASLGYVFVTPTTTVALVRWFPQNMRATAVSIKQSALTVGSSVGAVVIPLLAISLGWRITAVIIGLAGLLVVLINFTIYREPVLYSNVAPAHLPASSTLRRVVSNGRLLRLGLAGVIYFALQSSISSYLVLQLVEVRAFSVVLAGTFLMVTNIGGAAGRVVWGLVSDRVFGGARRPVMVIIGITSGVVAVIMSIGAGSMPLWLLYATVAMLGVGALGWNGVHLTFASEISGSDMGAAGLGFTVAVTNLGAAVGTPLFGYIVDRTSSYSLAWLVIGILTIAAAISFLFIEERRQAPGS